MKLKYRLGLDIGTNSIGWCVLKLDDNDPPRPIGIVRAGSRIFSDGRSPKTLASLAADRRKARQMRRRHDRVLKRMARFMFGGTGQKGLIDFGLLPADDEQRRELSRLDPYELRRKGLDQPLTAFELGRALYHLAKRRGFKSSRKTQGEDEDDSGLIKSAISKTRKEIEAAGCRTLGEYLAKRHETRETVRARTTGDGKDKAYLLYTQRAMVAEEFDALWAAQAPHHPDICTEEARATLRDILLFQRKLLPVEPGTCPFESGEPRIPVCSPLFQRFRLLQDLNHLKLWHEGEERNLTLNERNTLLAALSIYVHKDKKPMSFAAMGKLIDSPRGTQFNFEKGAKSNGFKGDATAPLAAAVGETWETLSSLQQEALAVLVEEAADNETLQQALQELPGDLTTTSKEILRGIRPQVQAWREALAGLPAPFNAESIEAIVKVNLPDDYASLSRKALEKIVPQLEAAVITYDKAAQLAGYNHSDQYDGVIHDRLPYYGQILRNYTAPMPKAHNAEEKEFGRIANPTVHIGLNQLRQVVNEIIRRWGPPHEIIVELARDFGLSGQKRRDLEAEQKKNQDRNEELNAQLRELGQRESRENRQRLMLWDELGKDDAMDRYCVYSGARLSKAQLFDGGIEIDHILPFSRSLDDSLSNKVLCTTRANRDKKNQTPHEAFGHSSDWAGIEERASRLPRNKAKRFKENALQDFLGERDFLDRQLTDTAYLSRVARQYLVAVCPPNKVWVTPGRLTAMLRQKFGLNTILNPDDPRKNRDDHRHHAVDAATIAICDRGLIQRVATAAARAEDLGENRLLKSLDVPWVGFREELEAAIHKIVVSHKPDHGSNDGDNTLGSLHTETNYGKRIEKDGERWIVTRKPITDLKIGNLERIEGKRGRPAPLLRDEELRDRLYALVAGQSEKDVKKLLSEFSRENGIRSVLLQQRAEVRPINDRHTKRPYRWIMTGENYSRDFYRRPDGAWESFTVSLLEASQKGFDLHHPPHREGLIPVMRIRKGDILLLERDGKRRIMRVASFTNDGLALADHNEANTAARDAEKNEVFKYLRVNPEPLRKMGARVVGVDVLGYVNDPGFKG